MDNEDLLCSLFSLSFLLIYSYLQEIKVLSHLKHPNIVQYYGSETVSDLLIHDYVPKINNVFL